MTFFTEIDHGSISGTTHNLLVSETIGRGTIVRVAPVEAGATVTGLYASSHSARAFQMIVNEGPGVLTLQHDNGTDSTAKYRFALPGAANTTVPVGRAVLLWYNATAERYWIAGAVS